MNNNITIGQVRHDNYKHFRVSKISKKKVVCNTRNGNTGRFSNNTTEFTLNEFKNLELANKEKELSPAEVDWSNNTPDEEVLELYKKANTKLRRQLGRKQSGTQIIINTVKECLKDLPSIKIPKMPNYKPKIGYEEIAALHISDTQIGKITPTYDTAIAEVRLIELVQKVLKITENHRSSAKVEEIRLYLGGDMVEGEDIFPHQAHEIDDSVYDQAIHTTPAILGKCILMLLEYFPRVKVIAVPGNHGRNGPRSTRSHPRTNWDSVCYSALQSYLLGPSWNPRKELQGRLFFDYQDDWYAVDHIFDWGNLIVHGDQISGGFAGFPLYGTAKKAWGWIDSIPEPWDYLWFGHFHTYASGTLNHRIYLANGTTESDNTFAQSKLASSGYPCQRLTFFNADHGLISDNPIYLTDDRTPSKTRALKWASKGN